jgi:phosphoribosylcarboxyaminoimidazole (NCAIR) mutase
MSHTPQVGIVMGSTSDWAIMEHAALTDIPVLAVPID